MDRVKQILPTAVQLLSHVWLFAISWTAACQASLSFTICHSLLKLMSIELMMPSNHLMLCHQLLLNLRASLVAQMVNMPTMQETWVQPLGWEDPLEKEKATHSSILAWRIPWTEDPGRLQSMGSQRPQSWEEQVLNKERNKDSDKEVNYKLDRGTHRVMLGYIILHW